MQKGLLKSIRNEQTIKVWTKNWLKDVIPRPPSQSNVIWDEDMRVLDLWYPNSSVWNLQLLRQHFVEQDVEIISMIRPSPTWQDVYVWNFTTNGCYGTQSGYKLSEPITKLEDYQHQTIPPVERKQYSHIWKRRRLLWHFMWKASKGALAVAERLQARGIYTDLNCPSCSSGPEKICHVLFNCLMAVQAWSATKLHVQRFGFSQSSVFLNLYHMLNCCEKSSIDPLIRRSFPWILWNNWKARNSFLFEKTKLSIESLVQKSQEDAHEWFVASCSSDRSLVSNPQPERQTQKWLPLLSSFTKYNIDIYGGSLWYPYSTDCAECDWRS